MEKRQASSSACLTTSTCTKPNSFKLSKKTYGFVFAKAAPNYTQAQFTLIACECEKPR